MTDEPVLVPRPRHVETDGRRRPVPEELPQAADSARFGVRKLPGVRFREDRHLAPQGYRLSVGPREIRVEARDDAGRWNAVQTLRQLLPGPGPEGRPAEGRPTEGRSSKDTRSRSAARVTDTGERGLPVCTIADEPDFPLRGAHIDISRNRVPTMETLYGLVDMLSKLKINHLELYTEHTFAYKAHEVVWRGASPLSGAEVQALDRYCRERGVTLVANQNSFGHMERWLMHAAYHPLAECPDGFTDPWGIFRPHGSTLSPAVHATRSFLAGLYDELLPNFTETVLNVGGDEPWELCLGRSRELCGEAGTGRVYLNFMKDIHALLETRGTRMMFYGDIVLRYPELIPEIPADALVVDWGYETDHPFEKETGAFSRAGVEYLVCAGTSSWNAISGRFANARENIVSAAEAGLRNGAAGLLVTDWGDNGHLQQFPIAVPGLVYAAAVGWGVAANRDVELSRVLSTAVPGIKTTQAADALLVLEDAYRAEPIHVPNATLPAAMAIPGLRPYYAEPLSRMSGADLRPLQEAVEQAADGITRHRAGFGELEGEELGFTADFLRYATDLLAATAAAGGIEPARLDRSSRRRLAENVRTLRPRFEALWHARSRPGGLSRSKAVFTEMLEELLDGAEHTGGDAG
ncbi:MAG: beta-N-acetylhexosaminidase [Spirochaetaceae bacterium]